MRSLAPPDASLRRGWIAAATALVALAVVYGVWDSASVFLVALLAECGKSRSLAARLLPAAVRREAVTPDRPMREPS